MRKFSLLLVALLAVSGMAFAQVSALDWNFDAEAKATFGVQLDETDTGIKNSEDFRIRLTLREEVDEEFGEGDVYGWIEVEEVKIELDSDDNVGGAAPGDGGVTLTWGDINARVYLGVVYIDIEDANDKTDEASDLAKINTDIVSTQVSLEGATGVAAPFDVKLDPDTMYPGVAVGVKLPDLMTVEFGVASYDYIDAKTANPNAYVMSIDAEIVAVPDLTINLNSSMTFGVKDMDMDGTEDVVADGENWKNGPGDYGNPAAIGASVEYALADVVPGTVLEPGLGIDVVAMKDGFEDSHMQIEIGGGVTLTWAELGLDEDEDDHINFLPGDEEVTSGVSLGAVYGIHPVDWFGVSTENLDKDINTLAFKLGFFEDSGDDGLLPVVGGAFMMNYNMVMKNDDINVPARSDMGIGAEVNADLGVVSPFFGLVSEVLNMGGEEGSDGTVDFKDGKGNTTFFLNVGTDINVIANTTFTIEYKSGDLLYNGETKGQGKDVEATYGYVYSENNFEGNGYSNAQMGELAITTKIEF